MRVRAAHLFRVAALAAGLWAVPGARLLAADGDFPPAAIPVRDTPFRSQSQPAVTGHGGLKPTPGLAAARKEGRALAHSPATPRRTRAEPARSARPLTRTAQAQPGAPRPLPRPKEATKLDADAFKANVADTEAFRRKLEEELEAAKGDRGKLNALLVEAASRIRQVEQQLSEAEARLSTLDQAETGFKGSLAARRGVLAEVLGALARMGRNPPPALLMRPDDALDSVRSAILLGALLPELRVEAETLAADIAELGRVRDELVSARDTLARLRGALNEDKVRLSTLMEERQRRLDETQKVSQAEKAQAETLARATGDMHDFVTRLEAEVPPSARAAGAAAEADAAAEGHKADLSAMNNPARLKPAVAFTQAKGLLPLPVAGTKVRDFGAADPMGGVSRGFALATRAGAMVSAPADGWVVYAGPFRSYGQLLIINAGGGYHVLMAGMERITVELGQFVLAGEPVAVMGSSRGETGGAASTQPQLYVEFRKDGISIDPAPWWAATDSQKVRG